MSDIVERLCDWEEYDEGKINDARVEAADEITALRAEVERLRAALEEVRVLVFGANRSEARYPLARAALEEKP